MSWIKNRSLQETLDILGTLSGICADLGGPVANKLFEFVLAKDYKSVIDYNLDYETIETNDAVYSRQIQGFFQKLEDLNLGIDKGEAAAIRFVQAERMCLETNRRLAYHSRKPSQRDPSVDVILHYAIRKISDVLGTCPSLDVLPFQFGPGANTNVKASEANPRAKLSVELECSNELSPYLSEFLYETPCWVANSAIQESESSWVVRVNVSSGKLAFVPKNAKTFRSIVIEPILNSFFQKGVGSYIRDRLQYSGIDLRDQTRNQRLAMIGSVDGSLSTIDISMASDCLAYELIHTLLPYEWADLLSRLRTGLIKFPQSYSSIFRSELSVYCGLPNDESAPFLKLQKFSSMGNGFTFELESLIFYGLAYGVHRYLHLPVSVISVYGDDIICHKAAYSKLTDVLDYCGFSVNLDKSYATGRFRESCGADYLSGFDIRPFYQKSLISDRTLYSMHNWFIRHGERELARAVIPFCTGAPRLYGPDGYGDGHLIGSYRLYQSRKMRRSGWCGGLFDTYSLKPRSIKRVAPGDAVLPAYSVYTRSGEHNPTDPDVVRGSRGYAKVSIYTLVESIFHD